jgi:hypothetical protein
MPRKKLIRRFEPRYGVSQQMLEMEAKYVGREMEDYLLLSANDLQEKLTRLRQEWTQADQVLGNVVGGLGEREKLAVQCLIVRDMYHLLELYCTHLRTSVGTPAPASSPRRRTDTSAPSERILPFSEWLFDRGT